MIPNYAYWGLPNYMKYVNTPGYYPPQNIPMNKKSTNNEKRIQNMGNDFNICYNCNNITLLFTK